MAIYQYVKNGNPCVQKILEDVSQSNMDNKNIVRIYDANRKIDIKTRACNYCQFKVEFDGDLSSKDQDIMEAIIDDSIGKHITHKTKKHIWKQITATEEFDQKIRIIAAMDNAGFNALLDNYDFTTARAALDVAAGASRITQMDSDWVKSILPESKWRT